MSFDDAPSKKVDALLEEEEAEVQEYYAGLSNLGCTDENVALRLFLRSTRAILPGGRSLPWPHKGSTKVIFFKPDLRLASYLLKTDCLDTRALPQDWKEQLQKKLLSSSGNPSPAGSTE